jgi:hypothetical protein
MIGVFVVFRGVMGMVMRWECAGDGMVVYHF